MGLTGARRVAVVGGGVTGLSAAGALLDAAAAAGAALDVTVLEAERRFGGKVRTERVSGLLIEQGPDSFVTDKPWARQLCERLGLGDELVAPDPAAGPVYVVHDGHLEPLPEGLFLGVPLRPRPVLGTRLLSPAGKLRALLEPWVPPRRSSADTSVAAFLRRRLGVEAATRLAEPLLAALYGGDAERLSLHAALPRLAQLEREHGSLSAGLRRARAGRGAPRSAFLTLRSGLERLVDRLCRPRPGLRLRAGTAVTRLVAAAGGGYELRFEDGSHERFDAVIVATPARPAAALLEALAPAAADDLARVGYAPSLAVALAYAPEARVHLPAGTGFLVPASERRLVSACTWVSAKWPHAAPPGTVLLRCFLDARRIPGWLRLPDSDLVEVARRELRALMGLTAVPALTRVCRWSEALPRYEVGHLERVARIERALAEHPRLVVTGAAFRGLGLPDCVRQGQEAAARVAGALGLSARAS